MSQHKNICLFCSLGCSFILDVERDEAANLEYDREHPVTKGKLCAKGNYILELVNHPMRLTVPKKNDKPVTWKQAATEMAEAIRSARDKRSVAVVVSGDASSEDVGLAVAFAANCLGTSTVTASFPTNDDKVIAALGKTSAGIKDATPDDIEKSVCTIAVGDPFATCPVIAGPMLAARNASRKNSLNVVSDEKNMTSRFAAIHLAGSERKNMADLVGAIIKERGGVKESWQKPFVERANGAKQVRLLAQRFLQSPESVVVLATSDPVTAQLANALVKAAGDSKSIYSLHDYGNARGIVELFAPDVSTEKIIESAHRGELDVLIVLGADLISSYPDMGVTNAVSKLKLLAAGAPIANKTTALASIVLPTTLWMETNGTYNGAPRRAVVAPPGGALSYGAILRAIASTMGIELHVPTLSKMLTREPLDESKAAAIARAAQEEAAPPHVRSSATRFADGFLTDRVSWVKMVEHVH